MEEQKRRQDRPLTPVEFMDTVEDLDLRGISKVERNDFGCAKVTLPRMPTKLSLLPSFCPKALDPSSLWTCFLGSVSSVEFHSPHPNRSMSIKLPLPLRLLTLQTYVEGIWKIRKNSSPPSQWKWFFMEPRFFRKLSSNPTSWKWVVHIFRPRQCTKCSKLGQSEKFCGSSRSRCLKCGS